MVQYSKDFCVKMQHTLSLKAQSRESRQSLVQWLPVRKLFALHTGDNGEIGDNVVEVDIIDVPCSARYYLGTHALFQ